MALRLRDATHDDIPAMARVGIAAFENDELNIAMFPHSPESPDRFLQDRINFRAAKTRERMDKPGAYSMVVVDDVLDGQIVGYAQWESPQPDSAKPSGNSPGDMGKGHEQDPPGLDRKALDEWLVAMDAEEKRVMGPQGAKDAWYLIILSVDPAHQRRGVARMLVSWGVEQAKKQGTRFYLSSTPAGRPFYKSLGLEEAGHYEIFGTQQVSFVLPGQKRG